MARIRPYDRPETIPQTGNGCHEELRYYALKDSGTDELVLMRQCTRGHMHAFGPPWHWWGTSHQLQSAKIIESGSSLGAGL